MSDKELEKFMNDIKNNLPNKDMFENVGDFEEDVCAGKTFQSLRKETTQKKEKEEKNENV